MSAIEQTMFFPRLRRQVKWMFVLLALVFAVGFVVFNVGSGGGGTGIGDLLLQHQGASNQPDVGDLRERIAKNPADAKAYRDLATALETRGDSEQAIDALNEYTRLRPREAEALRELAGLYLTKADRLRDEAQLAQLEVQGTLAAQQFAPPSSSPFSQIVGQDPITRAITDKVNARLNDVFTRMQSAYGRALSAYRSVAEVLPRDATVQIELAQTAEAAGDTDEAVAAYEKFLKLAPEDPSASAIKERIKQLRAAPAAGR